MFSIGTGISLTGQQGVFGIIKAYDPDAKNLFDRFDITPDAARRDVISERFVEGKKLSAWGKLDALWVHASHGAEAGRLNWLSDRFNCLPVNNPEFVVDRGYRGDGMTSYLNTQFNPATATGIKYSQDSGMMCLRSNTDNALVGSLAGFYDGAKGTTINPRNVGSRITLRLNQGADIKSNADVSPTSIGMFATVRENASQVRGYRDGALLLEGPAPSLAVADGAFRLGSISDSSLRACQFSMAAVGAGLTEVEVSSLYEWFQPWKTVVGIV